jgi:hypothetical protein
MTEAKKERKSLGSYAGANMVDVPMHIEDVIGKPLTILGARLAKGQNGEFAFMDIAFKSGDVAKLTCGGMFVVEALKQVIAEEGFPVDVTFRMRGRTIIFD